MLTKALVKVKKVFNGVKLISYTGHLIATRPEEHPKGKKVLMRIPIGTAIPAGVTLGKGTIIDMEI